jgi:hypothetical protein
LDMDAVAIEQHRHLTPAGQRQKLRCLVHSLSCLRTFLSLSVWYIM